MASGMIEHVDILGQPLSQGDVVAYRVYGWLEVGRIIKITAKRVKVRRVGASELSWNNHVLPENTVKLDSAAATMYVLRNSS